MPIKNKERSNSFSIAFTIPKMVGAVSFAAAGIAILLFYMYVNDEKIDEKLANFSVSVSTTAAAVTSAFYVGSAIQKNALTRQEDRAIELVSIWNSEYYSTLRRSALRPIGDLLAKEPRRDKHQGLVLQHLEQHSEAEEKIITILNFLEEVAMCVNGGLADKEIIESYFGYIIPRLSQIFGIWIANRRNNRSQSLYEEFCILGERWQDNLPPRRGTS